MGSEMCIRDSSRRVWGPSLGEMAPSADIGGSSKYSNENFEGRSGERFHVNNSWTWVSRSYVAREPPVRMRGLPKPPFAEKSRDNIPEPERGYLGAFSDEPSLRQRNRTRGRRR